MKKFVFLLAFVLFVPAFALTNAEIIGFYELMLKPQMPNVKLSVSKREKIADGFESVELLIKDGKDEGSDIVFVRGDFIFPDIIDVKKKKFFRQEYELKKIHSAKSEFERAAREALKTESQIIALGDSKKPKMYVFSDPECPYCQAHLARIDNELKSYQVNLVLTGIFGERSFNKIAQIYTEIKSAKTDAQKLAILRKYYDKKAKVPKASKKAYDEAVALYEKYAKMGLSSVPTYIELDK